MSGIATVSLVCTNSQRRLSIRTSLAVLIFTFIFSTVAKTAEYLGVEEPAPTSADQIESPLENLIEDFERDPWVVFPGIDDWRQTRGPFLRDGQLAFNFRSYDFDGTRQDGSEPQAWVAGGEIAFRSGKWRDILILGSSLYGSYEIDSNADAGGTRLLKQNGGDISVLGQAYLELHWKGLQGRFYRQELNLPYINRFDSRQIPNTFEAYGIGRKGSQLNFAIGYVDKIKRRDDDGFVSMGQAAGVSGSNSGTTIAGARWLPESRSFDIGVMSQYTEDIFNTFYLEMNSERDLGKGWDLKLSGQYTDQRSVGKEFLGDFSTNTWGLRFATSYKYAVLTLAHTNTDDSAAIRSPYGGRPSYLSSMIRDFDRANEKAWRLGVSYHFDRLGLPGVSMIVNMTKGRHAQDPLTGAHLPDETEYDYTVDFKPQRGAFRGFWLRARYAKVSENGFGKVEDQIRIILNYSLPLI